LIWSSTIKTMTTTRWRIFLNQKGVVVQNEPFPSLGQALTSMIISSKVVLKTSMLSHLERDAQPLDIRRKLIPMRLWVVSQQVSNQRSNKRLISVILAEATLCTVKWKRSKSIRPGSGTLSNSTSRAMFEMQTLSVQ